jgi:hypothetical protein
MSSKFPFRIANSRGVALIIVLWVTTILSVIVLEFCFAMRTEVNITKNFKEETQLYAIAKGGVQRAIAEMIYKNDPRIQQMRKTLKGEEITPDQKEWVADGRRYSLTFDHGVEELRIMSEAGKVNINTVSETTLRKIVTQFGLEGETRDILVDSILTGETRMIYTVLMEQRTTIINPSRSPTTVRMEIWTRSKNSSSSGELPLTYSMEEKKSTEEKRK